MKKSDVLFDYVLLPLAVLAFILYLMATAAGREVRLAWEPGSESNIAGYRVRLSENPDMTWGATIDVGNVTEATVEVPDDKTVYFAVTVYSTGGLESDPSNIVTSRPGTTPGRPQKIQFQP